MSGKTTAEVRRRAWTFLGGGRDWRRRRACFDDEVDEPGRLADDSFDPGRLQAPAKARMGLDQVGRERCRRGVGCDPLRDLHDSARAGTLGDVGREGRHRTWTFMRCLPET